MLSRILIGLVAATAAAFAVPAVAGAEPAPPPPPPPPPFNVGSLTLVHPADFAQQGGNVYAFAVPGDLACVISRGTGGYGCSGAIPGAPDGANVVTGMQQGPAGFSNADRQLYVFDTLPKRLEPGTRISFRNVTCGTDGSSTVCSNSFDGGGFVISAAGSFVLEPNNPLLLNTGEGKNPFAN
jgi:hypothetical protein